MQLRVNGVLETYAVLPSTVDDLLLALQVPDQRVAIEVNGKIVKKSERSTYALSDGDAIEIVTLVGGG